MMNQAMPPETRDRRNPADPYAPFAMPELGLREYWYPVLPAWRLRGKPKRVTILGEELVLFRDGNVVHVLDNRCPHRGARLSLGKCRFRGTISCPYHGWTFAGDGSCVAAIMEGPDSQLPGRVRVKSYPAAQRHGLIWLFLGDGPPAPFEEDVPEPITDTSEFFTLSAWADYNCNWRVLADNWTNEHHGPYVHGNSPELILQPVPPFNMSLSVVDHGNGKSMGVKGEGGINSAVFPGLGRFPHSTWHRFLKPTGRGVRGNWQETPAAREFGVTTPTAVRLPGMVIVARPHARYFLIQWATPLDANRTRLFNINCFRRRGPWNALYDRIHYAVFRGWAHDWIFSGQDKAVVESVILGPERLSKTDIGLTGWRRFVKANQRTQAIPPWIQSVPTKQKTDS
jgi:phenylpropionate dioxygenase-like ring-hydroxylating dioxygenase large terminal subunit